LLGLVSVRFRCIVVGALTRGLVNVAVLGYASLKNITIRLAIIAATVRAEDNRDSVGERKFGERHDRFPFSRGTNGPERTLAALEVACWNRLGL